MIYTDVYYRKQAQDLVRECEVLEPPVDVRAIAARLGIEVMVLSPPSWFFGVLMRVTGSLAFVAAARAAYVVAKDQEDGNRRLFLPLKNNVGTDQTGLAFTVQGAQVPSPAGLVETARVVWETEPVSVSADEAMATTVGPEERTAAGSARSGRWWG